MGLVEFPFILSGPIVRRVEPGRVFIWIATSRKSDIEAAFYQISKNSSHRTFDYQLMNTVSEPQTIRVGEQLFIHLIKVVPLIGEFPTDTLIGYNLQFTNGSVQNDFQSLHLLSPNHPQSIVYGKLKYPTFQIKSGNSPSNILYGSCRKLHGEGKDILAQADEILANEYDSTLKRPDSLFLMGDQIYADDVADPLILAISTISQELIGQREPLYQLENRLNQSPFTTNLHQINGRQLIMENLAQFTSSEANNHLIEFGEFAAMYLLSWNPELWAAAQAHHLFESFDDALEKNLIHFTFPNEEKYSKQHKTELNNLKNRFHDQQEAIITFQESLFRVRRLLANIPTYMIFDDHDITDDWNITGNWKRNVRRTPLGSHVTANGLAAYWAFQGWGNDPDSFEADFIDNMAAYYKNLRKGTSHSTTHEKWLQQLWNFSSWHFIAPTHPKAVFLDTRTQREYLSEPKRVKFGHTIKETEGCPQLINKMCWARITQKLHQSGWKAESPIIVVSATPVYGMGLIESFLHNYVYPFQVIGVEVQTSFDFEAWKYNGEGFTHFLQQIVKWNPSQCIILSGDVHYASAVKATVTFPDGRTLPIQQFTSSPLKNMSFTGVWGLLMKIVIGINSISRKKNDIYRVCDPSYTITHLEKENEPAAMYLWKDQLRYQIIDKSSIIETNNNLGLITIMNNDIQNTLLK
ncbi:hypothetical protein BABA_18841 [Neobacillus bataviensis LMG 21833]|uniref:PhoD-like phosphatase metallophosphatase domain-containing protein n=1 Tax=Neobacillus bataviensis LMG 21833 TaxID=1117379 RepID=K6DBI9_9BACI|nr:hypothetical protein [Neobacillus bataviensis]EKN65679.1 hypothetical protein BABA_18841 [Neobacillus bataviensis LMG 21833]